MIRQKEKIKELIPIVLFVTIVLLLFIRILGSGNTLLGGDFVNYFFPLKKFIRTYLLTFGSIPQWNPFLLSGTPLIANLQGSLFYPLGFFYYLLPSESAYVYSTILHFILGSCFMYIFMRQLSVSPSGSFISAIVFIFNGFFMGHVYAGHLTFVQTYIWIPMIFFFLHKFIVTKNLKNVVGSGLLLGVQILGGFPQIAFYTILGVILYGLFWGFTFSKEKDFGDLVRLGLGLLIMIVTGFALAAVQILPSIEFTGISTRAGGVSYEFATYDSLHPKELLSFLIPDIFGNAVDRTYWRSREIWHFWETCGYVGILPLMFLFVRTENVLLRRLRPYFLLLIVLSLILALGKYNPLYPLVYKVPGFKSFRIPAQILFLYVFGIAVVSGMGIDRMHEKGWRTNKGFVPSLIVAGLLFLFLMGGLSFFSYQLFFHLFRYFAEGPVTHANMNDLYGRMSFSIYKGALIFFGAMLLFYILKRNKIQPWILRILFPLIVLADLLMFGAGFIQPYQFRTDLSKKSLVSELQGNPSMGRVLTRSDAFRPNDGLNHGFPSILGYDPLILRRYVHYIQSSQNQPPNDHVVNLARIHDPDAKLLNLLHIKKIVQDQKIITKDNAIPYAHIVDRAVIKPADEILSYMKSDQFDPRRMVVLEPGYPIEITPRIEKETLKKSCTLLEHKNNSIKLKASTNRFGFLVLSEIFYPGWRATVDGEEAAILPGNYLFRVIPLDEGKHEVHLFFVSWPFRIGIVISLLTLAVSLGFMLWGGKRSPKNRKENHASQQ